MSAERERAQLEALSAIGFALDELRDRLPDVRDPMFGLNRQVLRDLNSALATVGLEAVPIAMGKC